MTRCAATSAAAAIVVAFHLRVVLGDEPWLAERYGVQWTAYARRW